MRVVTSHRRLRPRTAALFLIAAGLAAASLVKAEVVDTTTPKTGETVTSGGARLAVHEEPVVLECWQQGRRIIRRGGLQGLAVKAVTQKGTVAFKPMDGEQPEIFLLPFEDSLCLIAPED